ncbi:protein THEMIS [Elysia marginata]|uniref:Protein THEMIS n=1 Tax=Elysia marginata TaxID=1093978 RepID=A0AAV4GG74_9GAST|nr:protein THEMIS [Elysia marginata]
MASNGVTITDAEAPTPTAVWFSEFVSSCAFPSYVIISNGNYCDKSVQVSEGDILMLRSLNQRKVTLTYFDGNKQCSQVDAALDNKRNFFILCPSKRGEFDSDDNSIVMYPTISDLIIDCPTYFEATLPYEDPYLPEVSIKSGDRFRFVRLTTTNRGVIGLKAIDDKGNSLILNPDCRGNFRPLEDPKQYTFKEILELPPVQRRLVAVTLGKPNDSQEIPKSFEEHERVDPSKIHDIDRNNRDAPSAVKLISNDSNGILENACEVEATAEFADPWDLPLNHKLKPAADISTAPSGAAFCDMDTIPSSTIFNFTPNVLASPYRDLGTTMEIPVTADLRVKLYSPSDYEVPQFKRPINTPAHVDLPLPPLSPGVAPFSPAVPPLSPGEDMPKFIAPSAPPLPQPLVPLNINSFADIYSASLPAVTKLLDISKCDQFWKRALDNTYDLNVFRLEDENRLYVKDCKSDDVFSLSQDLDISFLEYPEKFSEVSELLSLPVGSELTILEDIASDYPKPISLRFGDTIRICTNTPQLLKMKYGNRDCEVLKVEKFDPGGIEPTKLKLPTDFEVQMAMSNNSGNLKPIELSKILWGSCPVPSRVVAILPGDEDNQKALLQDIPSDVKILRPMKQPVLVVTSNTSSSLSFRHVEDSASDLSPGDISNSVMGLPLSCGAVLAFQGRLDICDVDLDHFNADFVKPPVEKLTMSEFEERERLRKLHSDYEDIDAARNGSDLRVEECGRQATTGNLHRTLSAG